MKYRESLNLNGNWQVKQQDIIGEAEKLYDGDRGQRREGWVGLD